MRGEEIEFGARELKGTAAWLIPTLAALWSLFQLTVGGVILLDSVIIRSVHLAFALSLVFLSFPAVAKPLRLHIYEVVIAAIAGAAALYLAIDYDGLATRQGLPLWRDLIVGSVLIVALFEAARRSLGPVLPVIGLLFILMSLFASNLPPFLASRDVSLTHLVGKLTLGTEGIYGIPLRVSSDTVFLFVLFGAMLDKAGGGHYFVDLAMSLLGGFRGGAAKASILASGLTGMVSGSSIANTVTTGTFTIPLMKKSGYSAEKAAAIEVAASTNGQLMPPIMGAAAFIIAEYCNLPYLSVVWAALLPASVSYVALLYITHLEACKMDLKPMPKEMRPALIPTLRQGLYYFIPLLFLLYSLIIERRSASASVFYAILILALVILVRGVIRDRSVKGACGILWEALVAGGRNMMGIGVAVAAAGVVVGVVSMGLGSKLTQVIGYLSMGNVYAMLLIAAVISLVLGMGLPTTANYIVMANLTAPAILALSGEADLVIPLIAAHLFCFYFGILADDTPPVGLAAYAASAIAKSDPIRTGIQGFAYDLRTAILPFAFVLNTKFLMIGVDGILDASHIMAKALLGMAAFCSCSRGWLRAPLKRYEQAILLISSVLFLFGKEFTVDVFALFLFSGVFFSQYRRGEV